MIFWRHGVVGGRGGGPSLLRRGENRLRQGHGEGGAWPDFGPTRWSPAGAAAPLSYAEERNAYGNATPWPDLSAYARQPARGPTKWAHFVVMLAYVGLCLSILRAMWAHLVAMLAYVGLRLIHVEAKDPKNGNSKKNTVKRRIF